MSETDTTTDPVPYSDQPPARVNTDSAPTVDEEIDLAIIEGLAEEEGPAQLPTEVRSNVASRVAAPDDSLAVLDAVHALGERIGRRLDGLQTIFERELRAEATRERVVDRLHAELQDYKQDFLLKVQRPIFVDLVQLHDDIAKMIESKTAAAGDQERVSVLRTTLESIQTAIEDILYRQGVEPFVVEGPAFDPRKQRAVSTVSTDDALLNKTVAGRLRKGFAAADKVIRPEIVTVYTWRPSPPGSAD